MPDFVVGTAFTANDRVTSAFDRMGKGADKFGRKSKGAFDKASKSAGMFGKIVGGILTAGVISRGVNALSQGVRSLTEQVVDFDQAITSAAAKFPEGIKRGTKAFEDLEKVARQVGGTTQFQASEAAAGLDFLAMAGFNAEQAMAALPQVTDLATVGQMDLARATDIASDALGAFNLMSSDSAQLQTNLTRINDVFAKTVTSANTDLEMLFETVKDGAPVATAAGASIETFSALVGELANAGIKGSKAGTTLKNVFLKIASPAEGAANLLKKLGVETQDSSGNMRDIVDVLEDFRLATQNMGTAQRSAAIDLVFGKRAVAGVNVLLASGGDKLKAYRSQLESAGGAAGTMAEDIRQSLGNRLAALKSAVIEAGFRFIDAFKGKIPGAIDAAVEAVRNFNIDAVVEGIKTFIGFIKTVISVVKALEPVILGVVAAYTAYVAIQKIMMAIQIAKDLWMLVGVLKAAASAQVLLNLAMTANPIGVIVVAVGALVAAIVLLYKHWDKVKAVFWTVVDAIKTGLEKVWNWFVEMLDNPFFIAIGMIFAPFLMIPALIIKNWETVKLFFLGLWTMIREYMQPLVDWIALKWTELKAYIMEVWTPIRDFFLGIWNGIINAVSYAFEAIINKAKAAFEIIKMVFMPIVDFYVSIFTAIYDNAKSVFGMIVGIIEGVIEKIKGVFNFISGLASKVKGFFLSTVELGRTEAGAEGAAAAAEGAGADINFNGQLNIAGAPEGSTFEQTTSGAPDLRVEMSGVN